MAHYKRNKPRTKQQNKTQYKYKIRRCARKGENYDDYLFSACPSSWNILFHIRPNRRKMRALERAILKDEDWENKPQPSTNCKPHVYYW